MVNFEKENKHSNQLLSENVVGQATLKHYFTTAQKFGAKVRDVLVTWVLISALL